MTQGMDETSMIDEAHAVAVCAIRAQNSSELAKLALSLLSKIPAKADLIDDSIQIAGFNEVSKQTGKIIEISENDSFGKQTY